MPYPDPLSVLNKPPDRRIKMRGGNIHIPFPENLRDPMDAETAEMRLQNLLLAFL
jgi:hypothetical protein